MSLQRRLTLFFVLIVILPLAVAGYVVQRVVVNEISRRAGLSLAPALNATVGLYDAKVGTLDAGVRATIGVPDVAEALQDGNDEAIEDVLLARLGRNPNIDFLVAYGPEGRRIAYVANPGMFIEGFRPTADDIETTGAGAGPGFVTTAEIPVRIPGEGAVGSVRGGFWVDEELLLGSSQEGVDLSLVSGDLIVASTAELAQPVPVSVKFDGSFETEIDGAAEARATELDGGMALVASTALQPIESLSRRVLTSLGALLLLAIVGTSLLAVLLARLITQPLEELSKGAKAISEGRFDHEIEVRGKDEVGQVAIAFNEMSRRLSETITQLSRSRDQLERAVHRVGETLRSTHDMSQMLGSILNTAVDAVEADGGVLWRFTPTRSHLYPGSTSGISEAALGRVKVGDGVVGHVAERAISLRLPTGGGGDPRPGPEEPDGAVVLAVPVYSQERVIGVLALYREGEDRPFARADLDTVVFLAEQGGVAIENVMLHEEARRLSLMDGLTGIWNRRFLQMQFRQVLATSQRFDRNFSVLILDLDFFKRVNDTYGHPRGDAILVEFAQRVSRVLREVDTFARYGGEEFIVLLSETDAEGAVTTAEKIGDEIRTEPFGGPGEEPISLTVSIGVSCYPTHGEGYKTLIEAADQALYRAKEQGRDRVVVAPGGAPLRVAGR